MKLTQREISVSFLRSKRVLFFFPLFIQQIYYLSLFFFFYLFRATPVTYGSSQAKDPMELQLPGYTTATGTWNSNQICDLKHSSWQCQMDPLSEARDWTSILIDTSWIPFLLCHKRNSEYLCIYDHQWTVYILEMILWKVCFLSVVFSKSHNTM